MAETLLSPSQETKRLRLAFVAAVLFAAALWLIKLVESGFDLQLDRFGIYPRSENGAWGILWSPLLHGSLSHLFANTAPIVILGTALLYGYPRAATRLLPILYLGTGLGVWLFGRAGYHIGASGLAFGMMFLWGMFIAVIIRLILGKLGLTVYLDNNLQRRITGVAVDYMIVATLVAVKVGIVWAGNPGHENDHPSCCRVPAQGIW